MPRTPRYNVVALAGLVCTAGLGWIAGTWIDAGPVYPVVAAACFTVLFLSVVVVAGADHPHPRFGPANSVTTIRAITAGLTAGLVGQAAPPSALWAAIGVTAAMVVLDGVDGSLARSTGMASGFGARFDMETDAAFILILSVLVWQQEKAGAWVLGCGVMRYAFVAGGRLMPWLAKPLRPTRRGRIVAVSQFIGLGVALAPIVRPPASAAVAAVTLAALVWSFAIDVASLWRRRGE